MKFNNLFKISLLFIGGLFLLSSCGEDTTGTNGPSASFLNGSGDDATVGAGEQFTMRISASKGSSDLKTIQVFEDNVSLPVERTSLSGNPSLILVEADKAGFTMDIVVTAHTTSGTKIYSVAIADLDGNTKTLTKSVTVNATPPVLTYFGTGTIGAALGNTANIKLTGTSASKLSSIEVKENGELVKVDRLTLNGEPFIGNPDLLVAALQNGFTDASLSIKSPETSGIYTYLIKLTDVNGLSSEVTYTIIFGDPTNIKRGVLFNQSGPIGTGGLDLDEGLGTGSSSTLAEIKDLGSDFNLPAATNWLQKITGVNGSELKYIRKGQNGVSESFELESIQNTGELSILWSAGVAFANGNTSDKLAVGDYVIVKNASKYYLIKTVGINITTAAGDNGDYYEFDILR